MAKKSFLVSTLCLCTMCIMSVYANFNCIQEIPLVIVELPSPLDDNQEQSDLPTIPTRFQATISGHTLQVVANTGMIARMQVDNNETGEVVEDKSFTATTVASISAAGSYTLYIQSGNTMVAGEFEVE